MVRVIALEVDLRVASDVGINIIPRDEAQISVRALASDEVLLALQNGIQDHGDSSDLPSIAVIFRLNLSAVEFIEPFCFNQLGAHVHWVPLSLTQQTECMLPW